MFFDWITPLAGLLDRRGTGFTVHESAAGLVKESRIRFWYPLFVGDTFIFRVANHDAERMAQWLDAHGVAYG